MTLSKKINTSLHHTHQKIQLYDLVIMTNTITTAINITKLKFDVDKQIIKYIVQILHCWFRKIF